MQKVLQKSIRNLVGICLVLGSLMSGSLVRAQTVLPPQDALWAWDGATSSVCTDPTSSDSLQSCFPGFTNNLTGCSECSWLPIATDSTNVYLSIWNSNSAYSCPIADYGQNCTTISVGPVNDGNITNIAVKDGYFWTGTTNNNIWRCAASDGSCELFDAAGNRPINALVISGGYLYVALGQFGKNGLIWRCSLTSANSCENFNNPGPTSVNTLAAGNGYLWAGLDNGIVWRCSLSDANSCANWNTAGGPINFISYDAFGTLFIAVKGLARYTAGVPGVLWSCPTGQANACSTLISGGPMWFTTSNEGVVFSNGVANGSDRQSSFWSQTTKFTNSGMNWQDGIPLLYIPKGGVVTASTVTLSVSNTGTAASSTAANSSGAASGLAKRCKKTGKEWARLKVTGPYGMDLKRRVNLCTALDAPTSAIKLSALDAGSYYVTLESGRYTGGTAFIVGNGEAKDVNVTMKRRWRR